MVDGKNIFPQFSKYMLCLLVYNSYSIIYILMDQNTKQFLKEVNADNPYWYQCHYINL